MRFFPAKPAADTGFLNINHYMQYRWAVQPVIYDPVLHLTFFAGVQAIFCYEAFLSADLQIINGKGQ
jgi:hypothetical protein